MSVIRRKANYKKCGDNHHYFCTAPGRSRMLATAYVTPAEPASGQLRCHYAWLEKQALASNSGNNTNDPGRTCGFSEAVVQRCDKRRAASVPHKFVSACIATACQSPYSNQKHRRQNGCSETEYAATQPFRTHACQDWAPDKALAWTRAKCEPRRD